MSALSWCLRLLPWRVRRISFVPLPRVGALVQEAVVLSRQLSERKCSIVLVGFMGAGKSTVGALLARKLGCLLVDLDKLIVERAGCSIRDIFANNGEPAFRELETTALKTLAGSKRIVVATGGGVVGRNENWLAMRRLGTVIYLQAPWNILRSRIDGDVERPLASQPDGGERLFRLWESRLPLYEQADLIIDCQDDFPEKIVQKILLAMEKV